VKITDFGIARIVEGEAAGRQPITRDAQVIGTPHYMAPEQVEKPHLVDHRADIYSLGVVFYEMLTGELPLGKFAPPSRKVQVDVRLDEVVLHALEKEPERRYQQASQVKTDVETIAGMPGAGGAAAPLDAAASAPAGPLARGRASSAASEPSGRYQFSLLPNLLSGERVLHFQKRVGATLWKSLPTYRFNLSLPPLSEIGLYVTDRRVIVVTHILRLITNEFSMCFVATASKVGEVLQHAATGQSRWFGRYCDLFSEHPEKRWYRSPELRLRLYLSQPEVLEQVIAAAAAGATQSPVDAPRFRSARSDGWRVF
jgi:hypothetical protein